ncbi:MAG: integration host factor, partial [Catenulispora sp.]|nr:integration host factor [Catenulispora sp.]
MALPTLTPEQRAAALAKAGEVRRARSEMLADVKAGKLSLKAVLDRAAKGEEMVKKTKVTALIKALPGYGPA